MIFSLQSGAHKETEALARGNVNDAMLRSIDEKSYDDVDKALPRVMTDLAGRCSGLAGSSSAAEEAE